MAVPDAVRRAVGARTATVSKQLHERIARGRDRLSQVAPYRNEALEFWRGNQYYYVNSRGVLENQFGGGSGIRAAGKPSWRVREPHNLLVDVVAHEVSAASSVMPPYEVVPTTGDPEDASAAKVAERVARYGYEKWGLRDAIVKAVTHAVVADEAFAWVYWDSSIGPYIEGEGVGLGDVRVEIYSGNQVFWEPGMRFERSDWHAIDIAMTPEAAKRLEGYRGGQLIPDADAMSQTMRGQSSPARKMVLVTYYLERPTPENPEGRWLTLANDREICPEKPYPGGGEKPCLHKLTYFVDPDSDRDMGLVRHLLTGQRTFNDAANKIAEWKNLHLMGGRTFVQRGALAVNQRMTDEPGQVIYVNGDPNQLVKVQDAPPVPQELFQIKQDAQSEIARIAAQNDIPSQVESGKAIIPLLERDLGRRKAFFINLAEFQAGIMSDCLYYVQSKYDENRTLHIKGDFGWESIRDFQGAQLRDQTDVRVNPAALEPLTRQNIEQRVMAFADRQWISPEEAMHAISTGTAENLLARMQRAEARVDRVIRRIKEGGMESLVQMGYRVAPPGYEVPPEVLPEGAPPNTVPGWLPLPWDNLRLWRTKFEDFFQTEAAEMLPIEIQAAANEIYNAVLILEAQAQMKAAMAEQMMAADQGMANAARPQGDSPSPDMPQLGSGGMQTPNQPASQNLPS